MKFKVSGVNAQTGQAVQSRLIEADDEATAARRARQGGMRPTKIRLHEAPRTARTKSPDDPAVTDAPAYRFMRALSIVHYVIGGLVVVTGVSYVAAWILMAPEMFAGEGMLMLGTAIMAVAFAVVAVVILAIGQIIAAIRDIARNSWVNHDIHSRLQAIEAHQADAGRTVNR